jgi:uncharacterized protein
MRIALIGATGFTGSAIRQEALSRGHAVTAIVSRPGKLQPSQGLEVRELDVLDTPKLVEALRGHDVVISAFSGHAASDVYGYYLNGFRSILEAARSTGVRLLAVGGAGSLEIQPGLQLLDTPSFPAQWKATAEGARAALQLLRQTTGLDWTMLSPPPMLQPGTRTGRYRKGQDAVILGASGPSDISVEDYAVAMIDEAESAQHRGQRFTVAN